MHTSSILFAVRIASALLLAAFTLLTSPARAGTPPPNIILVMPDDVGAGDYACLGNPVIRTPTVDAFKKDSLLFTQFHLSPTCSPCRASLMSGRHEFKNGVTHTILERERMSLKTFTLAQMLKSAGYTTGIFGKWHLGDEEPYRPENRGFDEVYIHGGGGIGQTYPGSCGDAPGNRNIDPALWHNGKFEKTKGYCTDLFFAQAIKWLDAVRSGKQPFFAYIPLNAAHAPLVLPEEYYQQYRGKPGVNEQAARFFGMIENIDTNFGVLLRKLKEWRLETNTLVIYFSGDNGGTAGLKIFNAGLRGGKGTPYQGGTRAAAFFRWPAGGIPADAQCDALSAHIDIFPTLAEITGARLSDDAKKQVEGISLWPLFQNPKAAWPDRLLVHHVGRWDQGRTAADSKYQGCAIQNSRFTLVKNTELYDLKADPGETKNVFADHPDVVAKLRAAYDQWWTEVQPLLVNENVTGPKLNPFKELYWKQFGGGPDDALLRRMSPRAPASETSAANDPNGREIRTVAGWTLHISQQLLAQKPHETARALELLQKQLQEIVRVVPPAAVAKLKTVPLYFSPEYPRVTPRAEFHPDAAWLRRNGRDPAMARGVEFTNIRIFERETDRMPNFALHELAHAYHNLFLPQGFANPEINAAHQQAKAGGKYDRVEQWHGNGQPNTFGPAYALTNPQEFFAECTEAYFTRNDFFPFTRDELKQYDPETFNLLGKLWNQP